MILFWAGGRRRRGRAGTSFRERTDANGKSAETLFSDCRVASITGNELIKNSMRSCSEEQRPRRRFNSELLIKLQLRIMRRQLEVRY